MDADGPSDADVPGRGLIVLAWVGTAVTCLTAVVNAVTGDRNHYALSAVPGLVMLALGSVIFVVAFAIAVERSREEEIGVTSLFFLAGSAPRRVQTSMIAAMVVQTVVPVVVALFRPFTAFATLAPVWTVGLAGLWGARYGVFPARASAANPAEPADVVAGEDR